MTKTVLNILQHSVVLIRKNVKNIRLVLQPPEGRLHITAPFHVSEEQVKILLLKKSSWIKKHQEKIRSRPQLFPLQLVDGSQVCLFGRIRTVRIITGAKQNHCEENGLDLTLSLKDGLEKAKVDLFFKQWLRKRLAETLKPMVLEWESRTNKSISEWRIKKMKTRWGTCNINDKRLWFSLNLVFLPEDVIESVVVHEFMHLFEKYHNHRFYSLMDDFYPQWRILQSQLVHHHLID